VDSLQIHRCLYLELFCDVFTTRGIIQPASLNAFSILLREVHVSKVAPLLIQVKHGTIQPTTDMGTIQQVTITAA